MIRIESLEIVEFRGIRNLKIPLAKQSVGICGPNGTGKSGIVDAIEFALTGNITRLSGAGTAELSVAAHAPHVDSMSKPGICAVKVTAHAPALSKSITIERSVKSAKVPTLAPNDSKTRTLASQLASHPEFALSRREIVKYILTPPGERSKAVHALLRLDQVEKVRTSLQKVANEKRRAAQSGGDESKRALASFLQHLGIPNLDEPAVLAAVNPKRDLLKLKPVEALDSTTSFKIGIVSEDASENSRPEVTKSSAWKELQEFSEISASTAIAELAQTRQVAIAVLAAFSSDPAALKSFREKLLVDQGLELLDENECPLCDTPWDIDALKTHLRAKAEKAAEAITMLKRLDSALQPLVDVLKTAELSAQKIARLCDKADPKIDSSALVQFATDCANRRRILIEVSTNASSIDDAASVLQTEILTTDAAVAATISKLKKYIGNLPEPSKEEAAKEFLVVAHERYTRLAVTLANAATAQTEADLSASVFGHYGQVSTEVLEAVYEAVEKDFSSYYRFINREDEDKFEGRLTPSSGKLAFDVDFYGRGKFPPGAYHSEGHQDGMGLCLYLALMKHTLKDDFTLAVLDDVLMSIDAGHRREVCQLLKREFPKTQFILTTHDPVWLQFMRSEKLIQKSVSFGGWTVDSGPQVWDDSDVWTRIGDRLSANDVAGASATLRRYLEFISTVLADNLRARVEYHANGQYDLGDLWGPVIQAWKDRLEEAAKSAKSWGADRTAILAKQAEAKQRIAATQSDQWMINKAVHFNAWATMLPHEFASVADSFRTLLDSMCCANSDCREFLYVAPPKGERECLRCGCNSASWNLLSK